MVDNLFIFIVFNAGLCFFFILLYCGELTQCVYCTLFFIFWSIEKVCGIYICFWPISFVRAVRLARFVSSGVSAYQTLKCSGTGLGSGGGKKETVTRSGLGLVGCPNFAHSFCQSSSHRFCSFSKLRNNCIV